MINIKNQSGSAILEVLITFAIIMVGLLGLVGLQAYAQQANIEAYQRAQALILVSDMSEKLAINRAAGADSSCFAFTTSSTDGTPFVGTAGTGVLTSLTGRCTATGETSADTAADNALIDWDSILKGGGETLSGNSVGAMLGARGCISYNSTTKIATVAVAWQGLADTFAPPVTDANGNVVPAKKCAYGLYGSDTKRRMVFTNVLIPNLK